MHCVNYILKMRIQGKGMRVAVMVWEEGFEGGKGTGVVLVYERVVVAGVGAGR